MTTIEHIEGPDGTCTDECVAVHPEHASSRGDERPTVRDEAERLLSYWEQHGDNPEAVAKWAMEDLRGLLRFIVEAEA